MAATGLSAREEMLLVQAARGIPIEEDDILGLAEKGLFSWGAPFNWTALGREVYGRLRARLTQDVLNAPRRYVVRSRGRDVFTGINLAAAVADARARAARGVQHVKIEARRGSGSMESVLWIERGVEEWSCGYTEGGDERDRAATGAPS